jgi:diketogulonate reductase-like aldo/keto reductase
VKAVIQVIAAMFFFAFVAMLRVCGGDEQKGKACPSASVELNTGACMPLINLGGYNHSRPSNRTLWLEMGGRGFDTCSYISFDEQKAVGDAVAASSIPREDLFITTKVPCCPNSLWGCEQTFPWSRMHPAEAVKKAANVSMGLLGMSYVDLLLLGSPCDTMENTVAAYRALEELRASGKTRAIGISNFNKPLINALMKEVTVMPAVNQCEYFIGHHSERKVLGNDPETLKLCQHLGITFSAYSPFGWPNPDVLHDPDVMVVASAHNKSTADIALRWEVQQGIVAIFASDKESHDRSALDVFSFKLTQEEMMRLKKVKGACPNTTIELNNGACMPLINLGGWNHSRPSNQTLWLDMGGRGFDTASWDSPDVQKALGDAIVASSIPREDLFITTKVPCCPNPLWGCGPSFPWDRMNPADVVHTSANVSMELLGLHYVDLILLGTPCDTFENTVAAYRALEELRASGKTRAIGISNFNKPLINALMKEVTVMPAVNQCEFSIGFNTTGTVLGSDSETLKRCQDLGIAYSGYSVFGAPPRFDVLHDPDVRAVAAAHNKSTAEIALRWVVQQGVAAVTSSNKESHDRSDLGIFNFSLTQDEMTRLNEAKHEIQSVFV